MTKSESLVQFNASYYKYPKSISRGFWARYPLEEGLSATDQKDRTKWLRKIEDVSRTDLHRTILDTFGDPSDNRALQTTLSRYGLFAERFFHRGLRERVTRQFAQVPISLEQLQGLFASAWDYELPLSDKSDAIFFVVDHLYEQWLFQAINNPSIYKDLEAWFETTSKSTMCLLCGNTFRIIDLPDWIYFGGNGFEGCCFQCKIVEKPKKGDLIGLVSAFVESCGFIPDSAANPINYAFTSRLLSSQWTEVMLAYAKMGGLDHAKKKYGSWFAALANTGALPNGVLPTARGIRCLAKDGHECHSLDEQRIDNWLSAHNLAHEREPSYPQHPILNPSGKRRADWNVGGVFVEYFGLVGDKDYEKKMDEKILLAQEFDIPLIAIYPSDLDSLEQKLAKLSLQKP